MKDPNNEDCQIEKLDSIDTDTMAIEQGAQHRCQMRLCCHTSTVNIIDVELKLVNMVGMDGIYIDNLFILPLFYTRIDCIDLAFPFVVAFVTIMNYDLGSCFK